MEKNDILHKIAIPTSTFKKNNNKIYVIKEKELFHPYKRNRIKIKKG